MCMMLALCLMLLPSYYAKNDTGIIGLRLLCFKIAYYALEHCPTEHSTHYAPYN